jgi:DNA polymerase (family 10)
VRKRQPLEELPHVGEGIARRIEELLDTGRCEEHEELLAGPYGGLLDIVRLPGIGPKRARQLHDALGIASLGDLEAAAKAGRVEKVEGFGEKTQDRILRAIERRRPDEQRFLIDTAEAQANRLIEYLRGFEGIDRVAAAGSLRRRQETIGDLDILVTAEDGPATVAHFLEHPDAEETLWEGDTKARVRLRSGMESDLRVVAPDAFGAALHYFTGSKAHNIALRTRAVKRSLKISEYGVFRVPEGSAGADEDEAEGERIGGRTEEEVFEAVGLTWIPPELRQDRGEISAAEHGELPDLIELADIRGDCHLHTRDSDGRASIAKMAEAARERGYDYIAVTDHSPRLAMVEGLDASGLRRQWRRIDKLNERFDGFRVLKGIEVDILERGDLDLADEVLSEADFVIAAVHTALDMPRDAMTARICAAIRNPHVDAIAHPTGRKLLERQPCELDLERILSLAHEEGVVFECNAAPRRLDLSDVNLRLARDLGVTVMLATDAHDPASLDWMRFGVDQARRAWLEPDDVLNTRDVDGFLAGLRS